MLSTLVRIVRRQPRRKAHDVLAFANALLTKAHARDLPVNLPRLQRLVFLAQGQAIDYDGCPIHSAPTTVYMGGPYVQELHLGFRANSTWPIQKLAARPGYPGPSVADLDGVQDAIVSDIITRYGSMPSVVLFSPMMNPSAQLVRLSHKELARTFRKFSEPALAEEQDKQREPTSGSLTP